MNAPANTLSYRDLESKLLEAVNMSEVACQIIEGAGSKSTPHGGTIIQDDEMELVSFSVYHANKLVRELKSEWDKVHESNIAARECAKGGAA